MVPLAVVIVGLLLSLAAAATSSSGPHIADLNILLPPRLTNPVQYRLQGSDGCFSWFSLYFFFITTFFCVLCEILYSPLDAFFKYYYTNCLTFFTLTFYAPLNAYFENYYTNRLTFLH
ncbi:hypothetical protein KFK09_024351 [Dendrobium nobile]|uniref:Uncharacterized protein n=1 Tax=Dendrobium nobile TaxID=94219 RepID=A0A8T3ADI9_DENNO|nr:hypothetical protein KFK09_024351 [Dendrobium nobile]